MNRVWISHQGSDLLQGDILAGCAVPIAGQRFGLGNTEEEIAVEERDLIIITQSCDLENAKNLFAALCPIHQLSDFERVNPNFAKRGHWEQVRRGRVEGLHMLASPDRPDENRMALVVDFRQIFSLPVDYLQRHAGSIGNRWRLQSPYVEHFSQAFARFFMRVGLPVQIPPFS
jgi:hypothetical protein